MRNAKCVVRNDGGEPHRITLISFISHSKIPFLYGSPKLYDSHVSRETFYKEGYWGAL